MTINTDTIDTVRDLYRKMQRFGITTGNEAIYLRPELKTLLFGERTHLDVDATVLPIIADDAIPESVVSTHKQSDLYILDQEAYAKALAHRYTTPIPQ